MSLGRFRASSPLAGPALGSGSGFGPPGNGTGFGPAPPSGGGVLYTSSALGGFGSSATVTSAAGQQINFAPGSSLVVALQLATTTSATTETILGCGQSGGRGWVLTRGGTGGNAGHIFLLLSANDKVFVPPSNGICVFALVWRAADNHVLVTLGGAGQVDLGAMTQPNPLTGTGVSNIGSPSTLVATSSALTDGRVLAFAFIASELTATQCAAGTYTTGNRYALPSSITSLAAIDFNAARDFAATSFATKGSAPLTFAVASSGGQPALVAVAETRYAAIQAYFFGNGTQNAATDANGHAFVQRDAYAYQIAETDGLSVGVEVLSTSYALNSAEAVWGAAVNGTFLAQYAMTADSQLAIVEVNPGTGAGKLVTLTDGPQSWNGLPSTPPYSLRGVTGVQAIRLAKYLYDGVTLANASMVLPTSVQHTLGSVVDSIGSGFYVTTFLSDAQTILVRKDFPTTGTGIVWCHGAGTESLANIVAQPGGIAATVAAIKASCVGTVSNSILITLGTNDYGAVTQTLATFQANYTAFLNALEAAGITGLAIYCLSPIQRIAPATEAANGSGWTLPQGRAAIAAAILASNVPLDATYLEGAAGAWVSALDMYTDGIHLTTAGDAAWKASEKTALGY